VVEDVGGGVVEGEVGVGRRRVDVGFVALVLGFEVAVGGRRSVKCYQKGRGESGGLDFAVTELGVLDVVGRASLVSPNSVAIKGSGQLAARNALESSPIYPPLSIIEVCVAEENTSARHPGSLASFGFDSPPQPTNGRAWPSHSSRRSAQEGRHPRR
jgi:hypothetical protein